MSADAKVWFMEEDNMWEGLHDGDCPDPNSHAGSPWELVEVLQGIERCMKVTSLRWDFRIYPKGYVGLVGYHA